MNISTNNINFNGTHIIKTKNQPEIKTPFKNDVDVKRTLGLKIANGIVSEPTKTGPADKQTLNFLLDDTFKVTAIRDHTTPQYTLKVETTDEFQTKHTVVIEDKEPPMGQMGQKISHFINHLFQTIITKEEQAAINKDVVDLLSIDSLTIKD